MGALLFAGRVVLFTAGLVLRPAGRRAGSGRFTRKSLLTAGAFVAILLSVMSLVTGVTLGFLSATTPTQTSTFTVGTVVVGLGTGTSVQCTVSNLAPGDASTGYPSGSGVANQTFQQCRYFVTYIGTAPAFLGLDVSVANAGGSRLYDGTTSGLKLLVQDTAGTTFVGSGAGLGGTRYSSQGGLSFGSTLGSGVTVPDLLVGTSPITGSPTPFTDELTVDYNLAIPSSNANIGGSSTVTLTFHAVQAGNNPLPSGCATNGVSCTGLSWS